ncbi:MAG: ATP-dependent sacrificial sulfur transferase LarE [Bacteroidota bacterium]
MDEKLLLGLKKWFEQYPGTITAFSGGIDSALVLFLSRKFLGKNRTVGVISNSESLKDKDYLEAVNFAYENDIILQTIHTEELSDKRYNENPHNRCYYCKTHLYTDLRSIQKQYPDFVILNGTNKDDYSDYRPGMLAADENKVKSPLAELGITKQNIREIARYFGISIWDKPSSPCLSSRIPYNKPITANKLAQVEKAEAVMNSFGYFNVRARHYGDKCKIEVPVNQISELKKDKHKIFPLIKNLGFIKCIIDDEGLVSGKLNRVITTAYEQL